MMFGLWVYYTDDREVDGIVDVERHTECGWFRNTYSLDIVDQEDPGRSSVFYDRGTIPKDAYVGCGTLCMEM